MAQLTVKQASFGYGNQAVIKCVTLHTQPGELLGIIGPNGSGKTTLLRGLSGLVTPSQGKVLLNDMPLDKFKRQKIAQKIAMVPQNTMLPDLFTAMEIVLMGRTPHLGLLSYESDNDTRIAMAAMEITQTLHLAGRRINQLSGGEKQRLIIARAITQEAEIILLDEPTANLDINYQVEIFNFLRKLCDEKGISIIAALHDLNLASQYCNRLILLKDGKINRQGTPEQVIKTESVAEVFDADVRVYPHPLNALPTVLINANTHKNN
jgi:iron complex transport system ATP-binding protein